MIVITKSSSRMKWYDLITIGFFEDAVRPCFLALVHVRLVLTALALLAFVSMAHGTPEAEPFASDRGLIRAIEKPDPAAVAKWLDTDFTWTDRNGKTQSRTAVLDSLATLAADPDTETETIHAGQVVLIRGSHRHSAQDTSVRFIRVWVKRPQSWQLLVYQETNKAEKDPENRAGFGAPSNGTPIRCENPCNSVPYKPDSPAEQEIVTMWQAVERTVLTNDVEAWIPNFTDDFLFVTPDGGTPLNKADRVAMIRELRRTGTTLIPAEVVAMKVWVFGDAAVMRSEHKPAHGKLLHVTRLFEKHDGRWEIAFGQQTWVE
jgi:ketosteroid isomerase-like protein